MGSGSWVVSDPKRRRFRSGGDDGFKAQLLGSSWCGNAFSWASKSPPSSSHPVWSACDSSMSSFRSACKAGLHSRRKVAGEES